MGTKILYILLGLFLVAVFNIVYSFPIMFVTVFLLGIENDTFDQIQSVVIFLLAAVTSFALIFKIWPRSPNKLPEPEQPPAGVNDDDSVG